MRRHLPCRLAALVALVAAPLVMVASGAGASVVEGAGAQASDSNEVLATLTISTDNVSVRKDEKKKFKPAKDGQSLREGDTIQTDATGTAEIDYGNDAFTRLDVKTTFTIVVLTDEQGARQVQGSLETGQTWNRTAALTESGSFEQEAAGANATVRGTAFAIECDTVDHCVFTAVVDDIDLTGLDGVTQLLTPLDQCDSTDTTGSGELTGVLCGDITQISADDLPDWIRTNLLQDLILGLPDGGILTGTVVVTSTGGVVFVPGPTPTPTVTPATAPGAPTNVSAVAGNGTATVSFSPPASNGGSPITSYTATATPSGGGGPSALAVPVPVSASGPGSPIVVGGLINGTSYTFTVTATNAVGTSAASTRTGAITPVGPPPVIGAPPVNISNVGPDPTPGVTTGPNTRIVAQDEREVEFTLAVTNPSGGTYWIKFTDLPTAAFGRIKQGVTPVDLVTQYAPASTFVFDPVQIEPVCSPASPTAFSHCFTNGVPSEGPNNGETRPYPSAVTQGPVVGSVQWKDSFSFRAENDQGGVSAPVEVELVVVDDICTTGTEGPRTGLPGSIVDCPGPGPIA